MVSGAIDVTNDLIMVSVAFDIINGLGYGKWGYRCYK